MSWLSKEEISVILRGEFSNPDADLDSNDCGHLIGVYSLESMVKGNFNKKN